MVGYTYQTANVQNSLTVINQLIYSLTPRTLRLDLVETSIYYNSINIGDIKGALAALKQLKIKKKPNYI
jgi:hypothetical protein